MMVEWHPHWYGKLYGFKTNRSWHNRHFVDQLAALSGGTVLVEEWFGQVAITYSVFVHSGIAPRVDTNEIMF